MYHTLRLFLPVLFLPLLVLPSADAATLSLNNASTRADFNERGLVSVMDLRTGVRIGFSAEQWSLTLDGTTLRSSDSTPEVKRTSANEIDYSYRISGYRVEAVYRLNPGWHL